MFDHRVRQSVAAPDLAKPVPTAQGLRQENSSIAKISLRSGHDIRGQQPASNRRERGPELSFERVPSEGLSMSARAKVQPSMSVAEYLAFEAQSPNKHEYAAGQVFAMAGASARHNRIALNIGARLHQVTRSGLCEAFIADMRIQINEVIYYPDLMVCCDPNDRDPYLKTRPCLVVEVLSDSTERIDRGEKLYNYQRIPTLEGYLLVSQDQLRVDLYRRAGSVWAFTTYNQWDDQVALPCAEATLALSEIYERIEFDGTP